MNERYHGEDGRAALIEALQSQAIIQHDAALAGDLAAVCSIASFAPGEILLHQSAADADLHFILDGEVEVRVNGRAVARRHAGHQVGEMALIEPTRRSATITAASMTTVATISGKTFRDLSTRHPILWRGIARELARRLREREKSVAAPHAVPRLFIGSSSESLSVVSAFRSALSRAAGPRLEIITWKDPDVFLVSRTFIENLIVAVNGADFALLVMGPDDRVDSRSSSRHAPRDNVIYELGLFTGALGRERTLMAVPNGLDLKIPSDLLGMVPIEFPPLDGHKEAASLLASAAATILRQVERLGPK